MRSIVFYIRYIILIQIIILYLLAQHAILAIRCIIHYKSARQWLSVQVGKDSLYILQVVHVLIGLRFTVWNSERFRTLPANTPYLTIVNHQSPCDILALLYLFTPRIPVKFILKQSLYKGMPFGSAVMRMQKHVAINRKSPKQSINAVKQLAKTMKGSNYNIVLFPEGTRTRDNVLLPFKTAAIRTLLNETPLTVVVVALKNGYKFRSVTQHRYFSPTNYYVRLLDVFPSVSSDNIQDTITRARAMIQKQLDEWEEFDMWKANQHV